MIRSNTRHLMAAGFGMAWMGVLIMVLIMAPGLGQCRENAAKQAEKAVEQSVTILQKTQAEQELWEQEKARMQLLYEQLLQEEEQLLSENKERISRKAALKASIQNLTLEKKESERLATGLFPFLQDLFARLTTLVATDLPFLKDERNTRLQLLEKTLDDPSISIAEKYRRVMEAVFIEAEYGTTIEVFQEKILMGSEEVLGNIFRLGRVSLFFLSLDQASCAYFNVSENLWQALPAKYLGAIQSAVDIGSKRRPAELLQLPLGKLAATEDTP